MFLLLIIRFSIFFLLSLAVYISAYSQNNTYRIFLKDKGESVFIKGSELYEKTYETITHRALERRKKVLDPNNLISIQDAPLNQNYLRIIESKGAKIVAKIKWENYCVAVISDDDVLKSISSLDFVKAISATSSEFKTQSINKDDKNNYENVTSLLNKISIQQSVTDYPEYGRTSDFSKILRIPELHNIGIAGEGVLIGFLDSGFRPKGVPALNNINLISQYDFVYRDSITSNQQFDHPKQDHHGSQVLSIAVGNQPGTYMGVAPNAAVVLAKTENLHYERKIEEDWFFEGVEWLESQGVDIINASLGYFKFEKPDSSYKFSDLTGNKTLAARVVNYASSRGVLFVVASGNYGPEAETINTPADADSAFTVGSVDFDMQVSKFSSRGPDGNGRIRPHISAPGSNISLPEPGDSTTFIQLDGTSLSAPMIAGSAALVLSAFPELTPYRLKEILIHNSGNFPLQNNETGFGVPDIYKAVTEYDIVISPMLTYAIKDYQRIIFKISYTQPIIEAKAFIRFKLNDMLEEFPLRAIGNDYYYSDIPTCRFVFDSAVCYIEAFSNSKFRRKPYEVTNFMKLKLNENITPFGLKKLDIPAQYADITKSFVYPSVVERNNGEINLVIQSIYKLPTTIIISDLIGNVVYRENITNPDLDRYERKILTNQLSKGTYIIRIISDTRIETIKFVNI